MDFMTAEMCAYHKVYHVMGSVQMPHGGVMDLKRNVEMNVDQIIDTGEVIDGGDVRMVPAEMRQWTVMARYLEAVQQTKYCVDTTPIAKEQILNAAGKKIIMFATKP